MYIKTILNIWFLFDKVYNFTINWLLYFYSHHWVIIYEESTNYNLAFWTKIILNFMIFVRILIDLQKIFLKPLNLNITLCINQMLPPGEEPQRSHELGAKGNWPFLSSKNSHFQNEAFLVTMSKISRFLVSYFMYWHVSLELSEDILNTGTTFIIVQNLH